MRKFTYQTNLYSTLQNIIFKLEQWQVEVESTRRRASERQNYSRDGNYFRRERGRREREVTGEKDVQGREKKTSPCGSLETEVISVPRRREEREDVRVRKMDFSMWFPRDGSNFCC